MKLNLSVIKNESTLKLEKAHKTIKNKFDEMLALGLDTAVHEIDSTKREEVEIVVSDMLRDTFNKFEIEYIRCMTRVCDLIESELGT
jgi:hypothetical protein